MFINQKNSSKLNSGLRKRIKITKKYSAIVHIRASETLAMHKKFHISLVVVEKRTLALQARCLSEPRREIIDLGVLICY